MPKNMEGVIERVLYHELAHHIVYCLYNYIGHGEPFLTVCKKLGGSVEAFHLDTLWKRIKYSHMILD